MSCPECFMGAVHEGQPRGTVTNLHGLDTYVVEPTDGRPVKGIIVVIPDALGWEFVNTRLIADTYASKGNYKVYLPDFMDGRAAPLWMMDTMRTAFNTSNYFSMAYNFIYSIVGFVPFIIHNYPGKSWPRVKGFFSQLRKEEGATLPIGAAGFCWGGKHTITLAHGAEIDGKPLIDAAFTGHPSFLSIPADIEKITRPVSLAMGDKDNQISLKQAQLVKEMVEAKTGDAKGEARIYENSTHGFCVRATMKDENFAKTAADAEDQCIAWFNSHFKISL